MATTSMRTKRSRVQVEHSLFLRAVQIFKGGGSSPATLFAVFASSFQSSRRDRNIIDRRLYRLETVSGCQSVILDILIPSIAFMPGYKICLFAECWISPFLLGSLMLSLKMYLPKKTRRSLISISTCGIVTCLRHYSFSGLPQFPGLRCNLSRGFLRNGEG